MNGYCSLCALSQSLFPFVTSLSPRSSIFLSNVFFPPNKESRRRTDEGSSALCAFARNSLERAIPVRNWKLRSLRATQQFSSLPLQSSPRSPRRYDIKIVSSCTIHVFHRRTYISSCISLFAISDKKSRRQEQNESGERSKE